jgi:hypothetical protein
MSDGRTDNTRAFLYEVLGYLPPLTSEEVAHYRWLICGLVTGARRLAAQQCPPSVPAALDEVSDLFEELVARIPVPEFEEVRAR